LRIYVSWQGYPTAQHKSELTDKAIKNLCFSEGFLSAKIHVLCLIEAIAIDQTPEVSLVFVMGSETDPNRMFFKQFKDVFKKRPLNLSHAEASLVDGLSDRRKNATHSEHSVSMLAAELVSTHGLERLEANWQKLTSFVEGKISPEAFIANYDVEFTKAIASASKKSMIKSSL
jgi:hypothetical protein